MKLMPIAEPDPESPYSTPKAEIRDENLQALTPGGVFLTASICLLALSALGSLAFLATASSGHGPFKGHELSRIPVPVAIYTGLTYLFGALPLYLYSAWYADTANKEAISYGASIGMACLVSFFLFGLLSMINGVFLILFLIGLLHAIPTSALCHYIYSKR